MSGREFEHFMADLFRTAGYKVDVVGGAGNQGVDLPLKEGRKRIAVQCKKYGRPVGNAAVSAVYAGAKHYGAKQAWVVALEGFTKGAVELAKSTGVRQMGRKLSQQRLLFSLLQHLDSRHYLRLDPFHVEV
jgi:restriction system protein